jgi:hypothetical protein
LTARGWKNIVKAEKFTHFAPTPSDNINCDDIDGSDFFAGYAFLPNYLLHSEKN